MIELSIHSRTQLESNRIKSFRGNGKLLLTSEYGVLDGAKAIALPTILGQTMKVKDGRGSEIIWQSYGPDGNIWFKNRFSLFDFSPVVQEDDVSSRLSKILKEACRLNSEFLSTWKGMKVETFLDFAPDWGLGSSSSLLYCVAHWADVNPFYLHFNVSSGSGYDVACAGAEGPILYQYKDDAISYEELDFAPSYADQLYFIYLGKKQISDREVDEYTSLQFDRDQFVNELSSITFEIEKCNSFKQFEKLVQEHEEIIAKTLGKTKVQSKFSDYWGTVKSLGAWGGDFALVTSKESRSDTQRYFDKKGIEVFLTYEELIK